MSKYGAFYGPYFTVFGPNTERYFGERNFPVNVTGHIYWIWSHLLKKFPQCFMGYERIDLANYFFHYFFQKNFYKHAQVFRKYDNINQGIFRISF